MKKGSEIEPFHEDVFLHFKHKVVKDRIRQALYQPEGLTPERESELLGYANFVEAAARFGSLLLALAALGEFIQYSDSIIGKPEEE